MINFGKVLEALEKGKGLFFRGQKSRKPYKVNVAEIFCIFPKRGKFQTFPSPEYLKRLDPQDVEDADVRIVFTNGEMEVVRIRFLFTSWKDAAEIRPIRNPRCSCGDPNCKNWRHWYEMSPKAKELMLKENPGYNKTDLGGGVVVDRPPIIPGGWGYWEVLAQQQQAKLASAG